MPPEISAKSFVQNIKGSCAYYLNYDILDYQIDLIWQRGFGVFPLDNTQLKKAIEYVLTQKERHKNDELNPALEEDRVEDDGKAPWNHGSAITQTPCTTR